MNSQPTHRIIKRRFRPHIPVFKDDRLARFLTIKTLLTILVIGLILFVLESTFLFLLIFNIISTGHHNRLKDQDRTDTEIRNLACFAVNGLTGDKAIAIGKEYNCPVNKPFTPQPVPSQSSLHSAPAGAIAPITSAQPTPSNPQPTVTRTITIASNGSPVPTVTIAGPSGKDVTIHSTTTATATSTITKGVIQPGPTITVTRAAPTQTKVICVNLLGIQVLC